MFQIFQTYSWEEIPEEVTTNRDVLKYLNEMYFTWGKEISFQLVEVPVKLFPKARLINAKEKLHEMVDNDEEMLLDMEVDGHTDLSFMDGERRLFAYEEALNKLTNEEEIRPVVIDLRMEDNQLHLVDGYHRMAAAWDSNTESIMAYMIIITDKET